MGALCHVIQRACKLISFNTAIFIRSFHTFLTLGVAASLLVKNSKLHSALVEHEDLLYGACYVVLLTLSLLMYYIACFTGPGYVGKPKKVVPIVPVSSDDEDESNGQTDEKSSMLEQLPAAHDSDSAVLLMTNVKVKRCHVCNIDQPLRAKHCPDCKQCVYKFDHHCPWLETCVGEKNHRFFWLFLLTKTAVIWWTLVIAWSAISHTEPWSDWFKKNVLYFFDIFILVLAGIPVTGLLAFHTYLMTGNYTTWEVASRSRIPYLKHLSEENNPFHEGYCCNAYRFLCHCKLRKWAGLYVQRTNTSSTGV